MSVESHSLSPRAFAALRTELADLACELERQQRCDAADIVMILDARLRELAGAVRPSDESGGRGGGDRDHLRNPANPLVSST